MKLLSLGCWLLLVLLTLHGSQCGNVHWTQYITSLTDNLITFSTNRLNVVQELDLLFRTVSRAYAHCVSGTSPDETPALLDHSWYLQKPCGKILGKFNSEETNKHEKMTAFWALDANPGFYYNVTFIRFNLLPSVHDCNTEYVAIYYDGLIRVSLCGTLTPSSYYIIWHSGVLAFEKIPKSRSSFFLQYQVFNTRILPLTSEVMITSTREDYISAMFTTQTLTNQRCIACQHIVIYFKALFTIQYSVTIVAPMELSCYDVHIYDGPSTLLPPMERSAKTSDDFTKFVFNSAVSTAFQVTVEINIDALNMECKALMATSFTMNANTMVNVPSMLAVPPGGASIEIPTKDCDELPYVVFCLYEIHVRTNHQTPKLTIEHLDFVFPNTNDCSFGGMQMLPSQIVDATRPTVICQRLPKLSTSKAASLELELPFRVYIPEERSQQTGNMTLAFYSYTFPGRNGTMDKVKLNVTSTECQAVQVTCNPPRIKSNFTYISLTRETNYNSIHPSINRQLMCMKHLPKTNFSMKWKWTNLEKLERVLMCHIYSHRNHSIKIVYPYRGTKCVMLNHLPQYGTVVGKRYAPRFETVAEINSTYKLCGFNFISNLNTNYILRYSHQLKEYNTNNVDKPYRPFTIDHNLKVKGYWRHIMAFNVVNSVSYYRDFYTLQFVLRDHVLPSLFNPMKPSSIDSIFNNVEPHSGNYIQENLSPTFMLMKVQNNNTRIGTHISHFDIPFFHMYHILRRMTLQGSISHNQHISHSF